MSSVQVAQIPRRSPPEWAIPRPKRNTNWAKEVGTPIKPFKDGGALWLQAPPKDPISSRRVKKLIHVSEAAKFPAGKEPEGPRPYVEYKRRRICYIPPEDDVVPLMMMQQMIADSYADARIMWDLNKDRVRQEGDHPGLYGPNEVQQGIEERLMEMRLLSRPALDAIIYREAPATTLPPSRWRRCLRIMTGRKVQEEDDDEEEDSWEEAECHSTMKLWRAVQSRFKFLNARKRRPQDVVRQGPREYLPYAVARRPALPAIARFAPCIKPTLRRTTRADARRLRLSSIRCVPRQKAIPPPFPPPINLYIAPEFKHWGPIDYEDLVSLPWPKRDVKPEIKSSPSSSPPFVSTKEKLSQAEGKDIPFYIAAGVILFWICVFAMLFFGLILAAIWSCFSIATGFLFGSAHKD